MDWVTEHWDDVLAVVGGAYALALTVVKLTPTPRDDVYLGRVAEVAAKVYTVLCAVFGLNPKQGVGSKDTVTGPTYPKPRPRA